MVVWPLSAQRDFGELGLAEALVRLRERATSPATGDSIVSMAEVLLWLYALEEHHKKRLDHVHGKRHYFNVVRPASIGGLVLAGLIYARGLVTHSLIETANLVQVLPPLSRRMVTPGGGGTYIGRGPLYGSSRLRV